jgi:hypothetical protein
MVIIMSSEKKKQARKKKMQRVANMQRNNGYEHVSAPHHLGKKNTARRSNRRVHGRRFT